MDLTIPEASLRWLFSSTVLLLVIPHPDFSPPVPLTNLPEYFMRQTSAAWPWVFGTGSGSSFHHSLPRGPHYSNCQAQGEWDSGCGPFSGSLSCRCSNVPAPKPTTVSSEMKNKVWNASLKTFVLKGLLKKFKGRGLCVGLGLTVLVLVV